MCIIEIAVDVATAQHPDETKFSEKPELLLFSGTTVTWILSSVYHTREGKKKPGLRHIDYNVVQ